MKAEWLYGVHPVEEALRAGRRKLFEVRVARSKPGSRLAALAEKAAKAGVPVGQTTPESLADTCKTDGHQNIGARVSPFRFAELDDLLASPSPFLLVVDGITDTHNLGALIRTALCVGADGVILPKDRAAHPTPAVSKASAGAMEHIRIVQVTNLANALKGLKERGVWTFGLDMAGAVSVFEADLNGPAAIVVGGEEKGIRPLVKKGCDLLITIPQEGPLDSLNASVAGAVVMYEAWRQRRGTT